MYLILWPIVGLFTIQFNGYRIWEVNKNSDRPILVKQGLVRGFAGICQGLKMYMTFACNAQFIYAVFPQDPSTNYNSYHLKVTMLISNKSIAELSKIVTELSQKSCR